MQQGWAIAAGPAPGCYSSAHFCTIPDGMHVLRTGVHGFAQHSHVTTCDRIFPRQYLPCLQLAGRAADADMQALQAYNNSLHSAPHQ
jgi:hypothetical protein